MNEDSLKTEMLTREKACQGTTYDQVIQFVMYIHKRTYLSITNQLCK